MAKKNESFISGWKSLLQANSIVIGCHQRPDGDTLGSSLGLAHILRSMGKDVTVLSADGVPENYRFIPESETILASTYRRDFDLGILVDSESENRVGSAIEPILQANQTACIDHHIPDGEFGNIRIVDHSSASTAELIVELLEANDVEIDITAASQLLTGLIADTGAFRFANTSPRTFEIAARLTSLGADPSYISKQVFDCRPLHAIKLLGRALNSINTDAGGNIAWASISRNDLDELGAGDADTDSIVNYVGMVRGVQVYILFREIEPDSIRVSLRSRNGVDVNKVARAFDGGGHSAASGCTVNAPLNKAINQVIDEVKRWMES